MYVETPAITRTFNQAPVVSEPVDLLSDEGIERLRSQEQNWDPGLIFGYHFTLKANGKVRRNHSVEAPF